MNAQEKVKRYEVAKEIVDKGIDIIESLELIINEYQNDKDPDFRSYVNVLDELKQEIERDISEYVEVVNRYEQEEHDDEVRCMNTHEF